MEEVWNNNFLGILAGELFANKYPIPSVQGRFNFQTKAMDERFHKGRLGINFVTGYLPESRDIIAGSWVNNGRPQVDIIIPKVVDVYYSFRVRGGKDWKEKVQNEVVINLMHERDHLMYSPFEALSRANFRGIDKLAEDEAKIWAITCENTIKLFIEARVPLTESSTEYYRNWVTIGRDANNPAWKNFIKSAYQATRQ